MKELTEKLLAHGGLSEVETEAIFRKMFAGELSDSQIASILTAWRIHGETETELYAGARAMRQAAVKVPLSSGVRPLMDNCGTGGDGADSFNISTASAVVAACCGVTMVKHGNRSVSSKCGGADLLFALGYPDNLSAAQSGRLLEQTGFTFFFAPHFHPVMKFVMPVRKSLGVRTIFNLLGPLCNPLAPEYQLLGVGHKKAVRPVAQALARLGVEKALVVHSEDGLDEISACAPTDGCFVEKSTVSDHRIDPGAFAFTSSEGSMGGGSVDENCGIFNDLLDSKPVGAREAVLINAAAALWIRGLAESLEEGLKSADRALSEGRVRTWFNNMLDQARQLAGGGA